MDELARLVASILEGKISLPLLFFLVRRIRKTADLRIACSGRCGSKGRVFECTGFTAVRATTSEVHH